VYPYITLYRYKSDTEGEMMSEIPSKEFKQLVQVSVEQWASANTKPYLTDEAFHLQFRRIGQRFNELIPKQRRGLGKGKGVDYFYDERLVEPIAHAICHRAFSGREPAYIQQKLILDLVRVGILPPRIPWLFQCFYDRAVIDILNLTAETPDEFSSGLRSLLWDRGSDVLFEWKTKIIRMRVRAEAPIKVASLLAGKDDKPSPNPNPDEGEVVLLGMGLDAILNGDPPTTGHYLTMNVTDKIIAEFHQRRLEVVGNFTNMLGNDPGTKAYASIKLQDDALEVWHRHARSDWVDGEDMLKMRPDDLIDYILMRLAWLALDSPFNFRDAIGGRFFECATPGCGRIEVKFRSGENKKCRRCRRFPTVHFAKKRRRRR
jgi:hypothetical protein